MATADQVRGLKGTITKLKEENARLEVKLGDEIKLRLAADEGLAEMARQRDVATAQMQRADSAAQAHKARADDLQKQLEQLRQSKEEAWARMKVAELEQARLNGYIQRVAEDDAAREGNVEVADSRSVPRRPSPPLSFPSNYAGGTFNRQDTDGYSNGTRRY